MHRQTIALTLGLLFGLALAPLAMAQSTPQATALSEQEAHAIGVDAYIYFYSLVTMDLTRKQSTNIEPGKEFGKGPITLYDAEGFQVGNSLNRFAVSSWMPFTYNPDGSLDLYFQNDSPGVGKEANWLPAPKGPFNLTMRLYAPKSEALTGKWNPPPVTKDQGPSVVQAQ
jgi:hypothetical protein